MFSPRWSPDGRQIAAIRFRDNALMLFDFVTQRWKQLTNSPVGYPRWSRDGKDIYFQDWTNSLTENLPARVARMRLSTGEVQFVAQIQNLGRLPVGTIQPWTALAPMAQSYSLATPAPKKFMLFALRNAKRYALHR